MAAARGSKAEVQSQPGPSLAGYTTSLRALVKSLQECGHNPAVEAAAVCHGRRSAARWRHTKTGLGRRKPRIGWSSCEICAAAGSFTDSRPALRKDPKRWVAAVESEAAQPVAYEVHAVDREPRAGGGTRPRFVLPCAGRLDALLDTGGKPLSTVLN
jgi:hypothetical protein